MSDGPNVLHDRGAPPPQKLNQGRFEKYEAHILICIGIGVEEKNGLLFARIFMMQTVLTMDDSPPGRRQLERA